jgi:hypothetical protein
MDLEAISLPDLKKRCISLSLPSTGNKRLLIDRLSEQRSKNSRTLKSQLGVAVTKALSGLHGLHATNRCTTTIIYKSSHRFYIMLVAMLFFIHVYLY